MIILYRIYQVLIMLPVVLATTIIAALTTILLSALGMWRIAGYYIPSLWARIFCWMTLVSVEVKGREYIDKKKSYVFVANHQGAYDIFAVYGFLGHNFRWMMKKSLEKIPLVGFSCKACGHIFVDNSSPNAIRNTMEDAKKRLSKNISVVVFPEGSRTLNGHTGRFKRGAFILSEEFHLPIVPITIDGAYDVLPRTKLLPKWGKIRLTIHKPIDVQPGCDMAQVMEESRKAIISALPEKNK